MGGRETTSTAAHCEWFSNAISWPVQVWATTIVGVWVPALFWIAVSCVSVRRASVAPEPRRRASRWFSDEVTG